MKGRQWRNVRQINGRNKTLKSTRISDGIAFIFIRSSQHQLHVLTQLLTLRLGPPVNFKRFFISSKLVVELCRVPDITTVGRSRVWCAPNDTYRPRPQLHVTFRAASTSSSSWRKLDTGSAFVTVGCRNLSVSLSCHYHVPNLVTAWTCYIRCVLNDDKRLQPINAFVLWLVIGRNFINRLIERRARAPLTRLLHKTSTKIVSFDWEPVVFGVHTSQMVGVNAQLN